ncbi:MAG: hypothetical protein HY919_03755 [Elusimicrobia bacterium]|nr:hypothetical protein [Elusimicrobiota bacterium]
MYLFLKNKKNFYNPYMTAENGSKSKQISYMELLCHLEAITDEQISELRTKVKADRKKVFDKIPDNDKRILAAIDSFSIEALEVLKQRGNQENRSVGFHEINSHLNLLLLLTDNQRFKNKK